MIRRRIAMGMTASLLLIPAAAATSAAPPLVSDSTIGIPATDVSDTLMARRLTFANDIRSAAFDSSNRILLVSCEGELAPRVGVTQPPRLSPTLVAYSLAERRMKWSREDEGLPGFVENGRCLLIARERADLVGTGDGERVARVDGDLMMDRSLERIFVANEGSVVCHDVASGRVLWEVGRAGVRGAAQLQIVGDKLVIAADGLQVLDTATGFGWGYPLPASRGRVFADPAGGYSDVKTVGSLFGGKQVESNNALPLIEGGRIYFAAETTVVCLDLERGNCIWRRELKRGRGFSLRQRALGLPPTPELLGRLVIGSGGNALVVASLGWAQGAKRRWIVDPPTIALLSKADGHVIRRRAVDGVRFLHDMRVTPRGCFLLATDQVIEMDDSLEVRAVYHSVSDLYAFFPCRNPIVILGKMAVTALDADSLQTLWEKRLGSVGAIWPGWGRRDSVEGVFDPPEGEESPELRWVASRSGLTGFDPSEECKPVRSYPLQCLGAAIEHRTMIAISGRTVSLLPIPRSRVR